jgi:hypothetical protein
MILNINSETINKVINYLTTRPWREVEPLLHEISDQVNPQLQPKPIINNEKDAMLDNKGEKK